VTILKFGIIFVLIIFSIFLLQDSNAQYRENNYTGPDLEDCFLGYLECPERMERGAKSTQEKTNAIDPESFAEDSNFGSNLGIYIFMKDHFGYKIPYEITNGTIKKILMNCEDWSLSIEIISNKNGKLEIDIPRELLDPFAMVLLDNEEARKAKFNEPKLTVWFPPDSKKIEIIGGNILTPSSGSCKQTPNHPYSYLLSPLKQTKNDIEPKEIICKEGLGLIFKSSDNSPACVKPSTVTKLIERGWAKS